MSMDNEAAIIEINAKLNRIANSAKAFYVNLIKELNNINLIIEKLPFAPSQLSVLDLSLPEDLIPIQLTALVEKTINRIKLEALLNGPESLFVKYLSPKMINGGKGTICINDTFMQYSSDISMLLLERLVTWPAGFYRNDSTKETQLLLKSNVKFIICIDKLPADEPEITIFLQSIYKDIGRNINDLTDIELELLTTDLAIYLEHLISVHKF